MPKARVDSLEVLKSFRASLWKFSETSMAALAEAEGEVHRIAVWLETEQLIHWQNEIRKRHDWVEKCKDAYRQKTLFKDAAGTRSSGFDERKALDKAVRALEEAEQKYANVRKYIRIMQKELQNFTGAMQRFSTDVAHGLPTAVAKLDKMHGQLEAYVNTNVPQEVGSAPVIAPDESMSRGSDEITAGNPASQLTQLTPLSADRSGREVIDTASFLFTAKPINAPDRVAIAMLDVKRTAPDSNQTVAISADLVHPENLYLHHAAPLDSGDSGWYIGPSDRKSAAGEIVRMTVNRLLEIRPDFREILSLPTEFIVVLTAGIIQSVYNKKGEDLWTRRH